VELAQIVVALDGFAATDFAGRHIATSRRAARHRLEKARTDGRAVEPPGGFAVLYLALEVETAVREFFRLAGVCRISSRS
jgi:hypothetical protein